MTTKFTVTAEAPEALGGIEVSMELTHEQSADPAERIATLHTYVKELHKLGYRRKFVPQPSFGGGRGNQRPPTPIPANIVIPEHCSKLMKYVKYKKDGAKGSPARNVEPGYADMWVCSLDKQCEDVTSGKSERAHANFDMKAKPVGDDQPLPKNGAAPKPMHFGMFLTEAHRLGYNRIGAIDFAQTTEDALMAMGEDEWRKILNRMREAQGEAVGT